MCSTLLRFAEFYENPHFKGKKFSLEEFKTWYKKFTKKSIFTYNKDWAGFNLTGEAIVHFKKLNEANEEEQAFIDVVKSIKNLSNSYIICTADNSEQSTLRHEMAHALFATNHHYQNNVTKLIKKHVKYKQLKTFVLSYGYHRSVIIDEAQAYVLEDYKYVEKSWLFPTDTLKQLSEELNAQFNRFWKR